MQAVDLGELLTSAVADQSALLDSRAIDLGAEAPASVVAQGDRDGLRMLLANLVDNALRCTQRGEIRLQQADHGRGLSVTVLFA